MRYPPRLGHLATRPVIVAKLAPTFAAAHHLDDDEARERIDRALAGSLWEDVLEATWTALKGSVKRLDEAALVEKVAGALGDRPLRPGKVAALTPAWSAFLVRLDLEAGTASDAVRKIMESPDGQARVKLGFAEAGAFLAKELTRK